VRIWDTHGDPVGEPLTDHLGHVNGVAIGRLGDRDVIVTGGGHGTVVWDVAARRGILLPTIDEVRAVAIGNGAVYAAAGSAIVAWRPSKRPRKPGPATTTSSASARTGSV
jgi:hypothetical protein